MVEGSKAHSKEVKARRRTQKNGRGLEGALERKWGLKGALEKGEGSKAHSKEVRARRRTQKRGRVRKHTTLDGQVLEGALKKWGRVRKRTTLDGQRLEGALERKWGLEGALKREVGLVNALPYMIKDSKAHFKGDRGLKMPLKGK